MRVQVACIIRNLRYNISPIRIDKEPYSAVKRTETRRVDRMVRTMWGGVSIYTTRNYVVSNTFGTTNYAQNLHVAMRSPAATTSSKAESADECKIL